MPAVAWPGLTSLGPCQQDTRSVSGVPTRPRDLPQPWPFLERELGAQWEEPGDVLLSGTRGRVPAPAGAGGRVDGWSGGAQTRLWAALWQFGSSGFTRAALNSDSGPDPFALLYFLQDPQGS